MIDLQACLVDFQNPTILIDSTRDGFGCMIGQLEHLNHSKLNIMFSCFEYSPNQLEIFTQSIETSIKFSDDKIVWNISEADTSLLLNQLSVLQTMAAGANGHHYLDFGTVDSGYEIIASIDEYDLNKLKK